LAVVVLGRGLGCGQTTELQSAKYGPSCVDEEVPTGYLPQRRWRPGKYI
jgi:hypothetical protein